MVDVTDLTAWHDDDSLSRRASIEPHGTAVVDAETDREWTYGEFDAWATHLARSLLETGLEPGDRLGLLLETRPAFAALYFAAVRVGCVVVPLHVDETAPECAHKLERVEPSLLVCEEATAETATTAGSCPVWSVDELDGEELTGRSEQGDLPPLPDGAAEPRQIDESQLLVFTSGTGGSPKAVSLSRQNLLANATASADRLGVAPDDRWLCCLPMAHMGGLAPIVRTMVDGTTLVTQRRFEPTATLETLATYRISCVSLVPTMCRRLLEAGWTPTESLRVVLLGGAPATEELLSACFDREIPVHPTYGSTEAASQIATARPDEAAANPGTVGRPLDCHEVRIVDTDRTPVDPGDPGEVVVLGPAVAAGSLEPAASDGSFTGRGFATGDIGRLDRSGRLWITGRRSDRIVTGGENVDPAAVEAVLRAHADVTACTVLGLADDEWGERVAALVVGSSSLSVGSLREHCERELAGYKRPKTVAVVDQLPRTASGTVDRDAARRLVASEGVSVGSAR